MDTATGLGLSIDPRAAHLLNKGVGIAGGGGFSPTQLDNLAVWMDAASGVATTGARKFTSANTESFRIASNSSLQYDGSDFTVAFWVYSDSFPVNPDYHSLIAKIDNGGNGEWQIRYNHTTNAIHFSIVGGSNLTHFLSAVVNKWYFVVVDYVVSTKTMGIAVTNNPPSTTVSTNNPSATAIGFAMGSDHGDTAAERFHDGRLSKVGFWKRILTADEKTFLFNDRRGRFYGAIGQVGDDGSDLKTSLVSYWNLNEASGDALDAHGTNDLTDTNTVTSANGPAVATAVDSSVNENHGDLVGYSETEEIESWISDVPSNVNRCARETVASSHGRLVGWTDAQLSDGTNGWMSRGVKFDGTDAYIRSDSTGLASVGNWSVVLWFKTNIVAVGQRLVSMNDVSNDRWYCQVAESGGIRKLAVISASGLSTTFSYDFTPINNTWTHVAITFDTSIDELKLYVNGSLEETVVDTATSFSAGMNEVVLGASGAKTSLWFSGSMEKVSFYSDVLIADEVTYKHTDGVSGTDPTTANLVFDMPLDDGSATPVTQSISLDFDGSNDYVSIAENDLYNADSNITVCIWAKVNLFSNNVGLISKRGADAHYWSVSLLATGHVRVYLNGSSGLKLRDIPILSGEWLHIAFTLDTTAQILKVYLNGIFQSQLGSMGTFNTTDDPLLIGRELAFLNGMLSSAKIFRFILTDNQIASLVNPLISETLPAEEANFLLDDGPQSPGISDGSPVTQWKSREGNNLLFNQVTAAKRPTYVNSSINNLPGISFDGVDDLLVLAENYLTSSAGVVFIVFEQSSTGDDDYMLSSSDQATSNQLIALGQMSTEYGVTQNNGGTADTVDGDTAASTSANILMVASSGTSYEIQLNGNAETESADSGTNSGDWFADVTEIDNVVLGALKNTGESNHFNGDIVEMIIYSEDKTAGEKGQVLTYLKNKYNIA